MCSIGLFVLAALPDRIAVSDLDLKNVTQGWGSPRKDRSVENRPITIAGRVFEHGLGTHAVSRLVINLGSKATKFDAWVGVDDEIGKNSGDVDFSVVLDGVPQWKSGVMKVGDPAKHVEVNLTGVKVMQLKVGSGNDDIDYDHGDWAESWITYSGTAPKSMPIPVEKPYILTPPPPRTPRINGPKVLGAGPTRDFVWRVPATGDRPMTFGARNLPRGLSLDVKSGVVKGTTPAKGTYTVTFTAKNRRGSAKRDVNLVVGGKLALTPPMGWNSWNCFATAVDEAKVKSAADAFVSSGLVDHGWQYVNIDDCWSVIPNSNDPVLGGPTRTGIGDIITNRKFPNMKRLTDYIHAKGLRAGIYSSPGPTTCGGYEASYNREFQDVRTWTQWGFDYLKYDWCSYSQILKPDNLSNLKRPYAQMRRALDVVNRDIVYSMCQYGMGDVWEWGESVGGNCWRTTGDITDSWGSMSSIGFSQNGHEKFAGPGNWNDPDMLVVGWVGWGPQLHPTKLTPSEQYTHITLWSLLSSPLLIGCDLTRLDPFTLNLLTNDEVIAVNQDPLGKPAHRVRRTGDIEVWARPLEDGSTALGIFNLGDGLTVTGVMWSELGLTGSVKKVRDLWSQKDLGKMTGRVKATVRSHGCVLLKVW